MVGLSSTLKLFLQTSNGDFEAFEKMMEERESKSNILLIHQKLVKEFFLCVITTGI